MRVLILLFLFCCTGSAWGRPGAAETGNGFFAARPPMRFFGEREGLPNSTVYSLLEDRSGRLWATTQDGAARYSGRTWITFNLPPGRTTNFIRTLAETPDGSFWFGTETGGLWRFRQGAWTHFDKASGFLSDRINALHVLEEDGGAYSLFVGTATGIARYREDRWTFTGPGSGLASEWVWCFPVASGPDGRPRLFAATLSGFAVLEGGVWKPFRDIPGLEHQEVNDLQEVVYPDGRREWWVSAWGRGLLRWDGSTLEAFDPGRGFPSRFPVTLNVSTDKHGEPILWAGTYDAGLIWISKGQIHVLNSERGLPSNGVYCLLAPKSRRPTVWVGFRGGGLASLDLSGWHGLDRQTGLPSDEVLAFAETAGPTGGSIPWVATSHGIAHFEKGRWIAEDRSAGLPSERIQSLCPTVDGKGLWAGTQGGLAKRTGAGWRPVSLGVPLKDSRVLSLLETRDEAGTEVLWAGTENGLVRYSTSGSRLFRTQDGLPSNLVYSLLETKDASGKRTLWVGTRGGGVAAYRDGRWRTFGRAEGIPNLGVFALQEHRTEDGRQWIWAGTFGGGAARLELSQPDAVWDVFNTSTLPGLPSDTVVRIDKDAQGRLYLATQRGVARLAFGKGNEVARPVNLDVFALGDGLPAISCSYGASMVDRAGHVWVATYRGAAVFNPAMELPTPAVAALHVDGIRVGGQPRYAQGDLEFRHWERPLVFEFGLASYYREEEIQYRTQLIGSESDPTPWGSEGRRELTALSGGSYILRIWARDFLGRLSEPLDIPIRIRPAPWASSWAYLAYALSVVGILVSVYRLRMRMLHTRNALLQERVREATAALDRQRSDLQRLNEDKNNFLGIAAHDLRSPLNTIMLTTDVLADGPTLDPDLSKSLNRIRRSAEQMTTLIGNLLEINVIETGHLKLNPVALDLRVLAADAQSRNQEFALAKGLRVELSVPWEEVPVRVDASYFNGVLDNLLSNAIKFTPPGRRERPIEIRVGRSDEHALIEVQDQGPGLSPEDKSKMFGRFVRLSARPTAGEGSTGLGLSIVKSVVEAMQGSITVESELGQGATFCVMLPLGSVQE